MSLLNTLTNLTKAAVSVALTPVTVVVDTLMIPGDACDMSDPAPYGRTGRLLSNAAECVKQAVQPERERPSRGYDHRALCDALGYPT